MKRVIVRKSIDSVNFERSFTLFGMFSQSYIVLKVNHNVSTFDLGHILGMSDNRVTIQSPVLNFTNFMTVRMKKN